MLRLLGISFILLPCLLLSQGQGKQQPSRTKVIDAAAMTPFLTKRGADAVKRVVAGGDARKSEEKVLEPLDAKPLPGVPQGVQAGAPGQGTGNGQTSRPQPPTAPVEEPKFTWRLVGISYGKRSGVAVFQSDGRSKSAANGTALDTDTKIISVTKSQVVVLFRGKRLELMPW